MPTDERNDPPAGKRWPVTSVESQVYIDTGALPDADTEPADVEEDDDEDRCEICGDPFGMGAGPARRSCVDPSICEYCYTHGDAD